MAFQCTLVTPEQQVLDEKITQAIVPAHDGKVGVLTGRAPMLVKLGLGELRLDLVDGGKRVFFIDGGVAQMKDDVLTIVSDEAIPQAEIDAEAARAELAEASAQVATEPDAQADRQHRINRARTLQHMAGAR